MKNHKILKIAVGLSALLPLVLALFFYTKVSGPVPIHWNALGQADSWGSRSCLFYVPALTLLLTAMMAVLPRIDPRRESRLYHSAVYLKIMLVMNLFFGVVQLQSILGGLRAGRQGVDLFLLSLCLLFTVLGNFLPKCSHNYFVGIRTPWTLASPDCWRRTHRLAGVLWVVCGIAGTLSVLSLPKGAASVLCAGLFTAAAVIPVGYSLLFFRTRARHN